MAYKLLPGRPLAQEVKRLLDQETSAATSLLTQVATAGRAQRLHDARKHIKKSRALLRLARGLLSGRYAGADDGLRRANRALSPIADLHRSLDTLAAIGRDATVPLTPEMVSALRVGLESSAQSRDHDAAFDDICAQVVRPVQCLRRQFRSTDLQRLDRTAIVTAVREAHAAARKARRHATRRPSVAGFHDWRKRVKREWYLVRLLSALTGNRLKDERHQLAALDACLGELHDIEVVIRALAANAPRSRTETARAIRVLRARARDLRHKARRVSAVLDERPPQLARRVRMLWDLAPRRRAAETVRAWPHSA